MRDRPGGGLGGHPAVVQKASRARQTAAEVWVDTLRWSKYIREAIRHLTSFSMTLKPIAESTLPLGSRQTDLEELSKRFIKPLFDVDRFNLVEQLSDYGIDLHGEIKQESQVTGLQFKLQLKATDDIVANGDGSYSKSVTLKNLNYLLNQNVPAFYVFYLESEKAAYFCSHMDFIRDLAKSKPDWQDQENHTIRFSRRLDQSAIDEIYNLVMKQGEAMRQVRYRLSTSLLPEAQGDRILVAPDLTVVDDGEIGRIIELFGVLMCNQGRWLEVLALHDKGSRSSSRSAAYMLSVSLAYFYTGKLPEAMAELKKTIAKRNELPEELQGTLTYFDASIRFGIGALDEQEYRAQLATISPQDPVAPYMKLEEMSHQYGEARNEDYEGAYQQFEAQVRAWILNDETTDNLKLLARAELVRFGGERLVTRYKDMLAYARTFEEVLGLGVEGRQDAHKRAVEEWDVWTKSAAELRKDARAKNNASIAHTVVLSEARVILEFDIIRQVIGGGQETEESIGVLEVVLSNLDKAFQSFQAQQFHENMLAALSLKYEILQYLKRDVQPTVELLNELVALGDMKEHRARLKRLLGGGSIHQLYITAVEEAHKRAEAETREKECLVAEMKALDAQDLKKNVPADGERVIEFFPPQFFAFPADQTEVVFEILNVEKDVRPQFESMWAKGITPIANWYVCPITEEGPGNGYADHRGIESWRNVHRIRSAFFEHKFHRVEG
jgi:hypothetical protein